MDETVSGAMDVLELTSVNSVYWIDALRRFEETQGAATTQDWEMFVRTFTAFTEQAGLPHDVTVRFLEYAGRTYEAAGLVGLIAALPDEQIAAHVLRTGWARLITEHGDQWAGYDGTQPHWEYFRDQFYAQAHAIDPQVYATVHGHLSSYDRATPLERYQALVGLGLPVDASTAYPPAVEKADTAPGQEPYSFDMMSVEDVEEMILRYAAVV
ncbi:hypothetical protein [Streptomyces sp. NPDC093223]|uniref:hypothetical protein n=1 Tax=Streptomyces sp. NPDC093223 TaxID=3366033 RepID=UPI0037F23E74